MYIYLYTYANERPTNLVNDQLSTATAHHELQQIAITTTKYGTASTCVVQRKHKILHVTKKCRQQQQWMFVCMCVCVQVHVCINSIHTSIRDYKNENAMAPWSTLCLYVCLYIYIYMYATNIRLLGADAEYKNFQWRHKRHSVCLTYRICSRMSSHTYTYSCIFEYVCMSS